MNPGAGSFPPPPQSEQLREFLVRRERELSQQISALRGQIVPKEKELAEVHKAMVALGIFSGPLSAFVGDDASCTPSLPQTNSPHPPPPFGLAVLGNALQASLTIKQMIDRALRDHFRGGATPIELREYFRVAYGRDVDRNSISPQLARLREERRVVAENGRWRLTAAGLLYDHPTSWNAADEPSAIQPTLTAEPKHNWPNSD